MNKIVLSVELHDERMKKKAMMAVAEIPGIESVSVDMKDKKLTVTGNSDPVCVVGKLRKRWNTHILSVGPAKEPEKKKKDEPKKDEPKKDEPKKDDHKPKKEEEKKKDPIENCADLLRLCQGYYYHPPMGHPCYCTCGCVQEDPSICVIC